MTNPLRRSPHPLLLEIPARPWLAEHSARAGRKLTLDEVPDEALRRIAARGFHGVWLMGVWKSGTIARRLALTYPTLLAEYERHFSDWELEEVGGSPYAIGAYEVAPSLGGDGALDRLRARLRQHGLGLLLDFVGNHFARDHAWIDAHPDWFVSGTARDLAKTPGNWFAHFGVDGVDRVFAHGRDPHFEGWSDTVQVDVRSNAFREAQTRTLLDLAKRCDGLRCDVAMLLLRDVFRATWGERANEATGEFWSTAIDAVRVEFPETVFLAEAYWGLESRMVELGFDFAYDKGVLDLLAAGDLAGLRRASELPAPARRKRAHFLENHDEERALAVFGESRLRAASLFAFTLPGMRFFLEGQSEGRRLRVPVQIGRAPREPDVEWCRAFHEALFVALKDPAFHSGDWAPLAHHAAGPGDESFASIAGNRWLDSSTAWIALANLSGAAARAILAAEEIDDIAEIQDALGGASVTRSPEDIAEKRLSVSLAPHEAKLLRARARRRPLLAASFPG